MPSTNAMLPTAIGGSILAIYGVGLTLRVIRQRLGNKIMLGDGTKEFLMNYVKVKTEDPLNKAAIADAANFGATPYFGVNTAIRAHGNFIETVPWVVTLSAVVGLTEALPTVAHGAIMGTFVVMRIAHAELGLLRAGGMGRGRSIGMVVTLLTTLTFAGALLVQSGKQLFA
ncbi:membrane-associated, eicosanoid/glutathione metabolism protein [Blastocladiella britannica]|nr:membrane-associated, eicosanoid/glutathione metabolism protein [Blastocladiella britannica]